MGTYKILIIALFCLVAHQAHGYAITRPSLVSDLELAINYMEDATNFILRTCGTTLMNFALFLKTNSSDSPVKCTLVDEMKISEITFDFENEILSYNLTPPAIKVETPFDIFEVYNVSHLNEFFAKSNLSKIFRSPKEYTQIYLNITNDSIKNVTVTKYPFHETMYLNDRFLRSDPWTSVQEEVEVKHNKETSDKKQTISDSIREFLRKGHLLYTTKCSTTKEKEQALINFETIETFKNRIEKIQSHT